LSTLYLVATPIGNLKDITSRALQILRTVSLIAAEDTRQTRKLLAHYGISTRLTSYFEYNKLTKVETILAELQIGDVALVSDAGTPGLNDPGYELVRAVLKAGHAISPIPGACAPIAALVASGLPTDTFLYLGYLPRKAGERHHRLAEIADFPHTLVLLEAPHRLLACLEDIHQVLGDREIAVARELTKIHEEIFRGTVMAACHHFAAKAPRGEFTLVVAGYEAQPEVISLEKVKKLVEALLDSGAPVTQIASQAASQTGWPRREVYTIVTQIQQARKGK